MTIREALRSPQRAMYNYDIKREKARREREDRGDHGARRMRFVGVFAVGVLAGAGAIELINQEADATTRDSAFETVE